MKHRPAEAQWKRHRLKFICRAIIVIETNIDDKTRRLTALSWSGFALGALMCLYSGSDERTGRVLVTVLANPNC
jgi:hypothetical protein